MQRIGNNVTERDGAVADGFVHVLVFEPVFAAISKTAIPPEAGHELQDVAQDQQAHYEHRVQIAEELQARAGVDLIGPYRVQTHHAQEAQIRFQNLGFAVS